MPQPSSETAVEPTVTPSPLAVVGEVLAASETWNAWRTADEQDAQVALHLLPAFAATLAIEEPLALIVSDDATAERIAESIGWYMPAGSVAPLISRGVLYGGGIAPAPSRVGGRSRAIALGNTPRVVVASVHAVTELIPTEHATYAVRVSVGQVIDRDVLVTELVNAGYERVEQVEEKGQIAVRGDIIDVFSTTDRNPVRIEFFDDEIEQIRHFSAYTQRSLEQLQTQLIHPAVELAGGRSDYGSHEALQQEPVVQHGGPLESIFASRLRHHRLFVWDPVVVAEATEEILLELGASHAELDGYVAEDELEKLVAGATVLDPLETGQRFRFAAQPPTFAALGFSEAESELRSLANREVRTIVTFPHRGHAQRTADRIRKANITMLEDSRDSLMNAQAGVSVDRPDVWFAVSLAATGFVSRELGIAVVPSGKLFRQRIERDSSSTPHPLAAFTHLKVGDYVVHEEHGVGRFAGFETKTVSDVTRDYLYLEFLGDDRLYVPHEQMSKVTRYIGADGSAPALSKLGGKKWANLKNRARTAVRELAGELLVLYAKRARATGHAFAADDELVDRFELQFPYAETPDQLKAIVSVKEDMERPQPMDRLICGDVGFGKTEVAMRAAVKAATDGRQTMVLVPTTVLAQQHLVSFRERINDLPFEVDMVSRFRTKKEITAIVERFTSGKLDILIGTHRLLSSDILPRDLGLVIVDEEQRFGVAQKEMLRHLRLEVDVLSMSATPIPRTLHMSLAGLRDISVIETAPEGRRAINTHVGEYDEDLVRMAIQRELDRDGQVFYLHNRVETIDEAAIKIKQIVPDARVGVGHGQLSERELEKVMMGFIRNDFDVLVATTIIESGLDIPTANTLLVDRADMLGLSQLYQIRGRVGRSDRSAHAYLFYPSRRELSEEARARLTTLSDFTDLGSGSRIAMRDLELRGAGNLLGAAQSGHVAAIGFELYVEMLAESVAELSGEPAPVDRVPQIDARINAYIPADYVSSEAIKIDIHRRIALARDEVQLAEITAELEDRFGEVPQAVNNLMILTRLRQLMLEIRADRLVLVAGRITLAQVALSSQDVTKLRITEPLVSYSVGKSMVQAQVPDMDRGLERALDFVSHVVDVVDI